MIKKTYQSSKKKELAYRGVLFFVQKRYIHNESRINIKRRSMNIIMTNEMNEVDNYGYFSIYHGFINGYVMYNLWKNFEY